MLHASMQGPWPKFPPFGLGIFYDVGNPIQPGDGVDGSMDWWFFYNLRTRLQINQLGPNVLDPSFHGYPWAWAMQITPPIYDSMYIHVRKVTGSKYFKFNFWPYWRRRLEIYQQATDRREVRTINGPVGGSVCSFWILLYLYICCRSCPVVAGQRHILDFNNQVRTFPILPAFPTCRTHPRYLPALIVAHWAQKSNDLHIWPTFFGIPSPSYS